MLLIFVGPLISQSMPMEHHTGMSMPVSMSATMDMPAQHPASHGAAHGSEHGAHHQAPAADNSIDHALWAKCGYCTLLFSCPALIQSVAIIALPAARPADFFNGVTQEGHARSSVFPNARSRAPPLFATR